MAVYEFEQGSTGPKIRSRPAQQNVITVKTPYYDKYGQRIRKDKSNVDRLHDYRIWRRDFKRRGVGAGRLYALDCDQVEYRVHDGQIVPVGVLEMTRVDVPDVTTFHELERRFGLTGQGRFAKFVAESLKTHAWIVGYQDPLNHFWLYNLNCDEGWWAMDINEYEQWLVAACPHPPAEFRCKEFE